MDFIVFLLLYAAMQNVIVYVCIIIFVVLVLECPNGHPYFIGNVSVYVTTFIRMLFMHFVHITSLYKKVVITGKVLSVLLMSAISVHH